MDKSEMSKKISVFGNVDMAQPLEQFHKNALFHEDPAKMKANLTIGAYRDDNNNPFVFPVVRKAEKWLSENDQFFSSNEEEEKDCLRRDFDYSAFGFQPFLDSTIDLIFGTNSKVVNEGRVLGVQCLGGTGALRLGAEFIRKVLQLDQVLISDPSWREHANIFSKAGFCKIKLYRYYDRQNHRLDFSGMLTDLGSAEERSVMLQPVAHNPTGLDLSREQWSLVLEAIKQRNCFCFFDFAYQGFASGDTEVDAWAVRHFADNGMEEMLVSHTFGKNFGYYGERIGALAIVCQSAESIGAIRSRLDPLIGAIWSCPPFYGARMVHRVLSEPDQRAQWEETVKKMAFRLKEMRERLGAQLARLTNSDDRWPQIARSKGFFAYTGLSAAQVEYMEKEFHVYLLSDGRINLAGLNQHNLDYVASAIVQAIANRPFQ